MEMMPDYFSGIVAILLLTGFVKVITTFSILRFGIGLDGIGFGIAIFALSLAVAFLVVEPQVVGVGGGNRLLSLSLSDPAGKEPVDYQNKFRPFLEKNSDPELTTKLADLSGRLEKKERDQPPQSNPDKKVSFSVLITAFLITELREAFEIGFLLLVPFLVIDLLIANVLVTVGINQIPVAIVSLPLKILLFFAVNGWTLITEKLINSYV